MVDRDRWTLQEVVGNGDNPFDAHRPLQHAARPARRDPPVGYAGERGRTRANRRRQRAIEGVVDHHDLLHAIVTAVDLARIRCGGARLLRGSRRRNIVGRGSDDIDVNLQIGHGGLQRVGVGERPYRDPVVGDAEEFEGTHEVLDALHPVRRAVVARLVRRSHRRLHGIPDAINVRRRYCAGVDIRHGRQRAGRVACCGRKLLLRDAIDLRTIEATREQRKLVRRDVQAVVVRPDQRLIGEARAVRVGRRAVRAIVGRVDAEYLEPVQRIARLADRDEDRCRAERGSTQGIHDLFEDRDEEPLGVVVVQTLGIAGERAANRRGHRAIDRVGKAKKRVESSDRTGNPLVGRGIPQSDHEIDRLEHVAVTDAQALVGWLDAEIISAVGGAIVEMVETRGAKNAEWRTGDGGDGTCCRRGGDYRLRRRRIVVLAQLRPADRIPLDATESSSAGVAEHQRCSLGEPNEQSGACKQDRACDGAICANDQTLMCRHVYSSN